MKGLNEHIDIIIGALEDYKRWWDEDSEDDKNLRKRIDDALDWVKSVEV